MSGDVQSLTIKPSAYSKEVPLLEHMILTETMGQKPVFSQAQIVPLRISEIERTSMGEILTVFNHTHTRLEDL